MITFDKKESIITVTPAPSTMLEAVVNSIEDSYAEISDNHFIINLLSVEEISNHELLLFLGISRKHKKKQKSFVIVTDKINYEDTISEALLIVPTYQEAHDIIAMEEIERNLGL